MSKAITFDTLQYAKKAKEAGFTDQQAEFQAEEMARVIDEQNFQLATKDDLKALEERLTYKLTIRLGFMLAATISILAALIKL